jgi:hypothetical protein
MWMSDLFQAIINGIIFGFSHLNSDAMFPSFKSVPLLLPVAFMIFFMNCSSENKVNNTPEVFILICYNPHVDLLLSLGAHLCQVLQTC